MFTPNKSQSKDLNLYQLINSIPIFYDDFEDYQKSAIDYLIKTNYLNNDSKLKTTPKAFFAYWIYKNGCINYFQSFANLTIKNRKIVSYDLKEDLKSSKKTGVYKTEDSLFSKQEQEFLNFILKNKFGDSWGLRNIYTHGAQKNSENDYLLLLYIQFCIILKINDDFCAKSYLDDEQS